MQSVQFPIADELATIPAMISTLSNILLPVIGLILFAMIVYGGVTKMTAAGDAEKEKQAVSILKNAVIGAAIVVLARVIVDTVGALLNIPKI